MNESNPSSSEEFSKLTSQVKALQQEITFLQMKVTNRENLIIERLREKSLILQMMKELLCAFDGPVQTRDRVAEFLHKEIGYMGAWHPSQKYTHEHLCAVRGWM